MNSEDEGSDSSPAPSPSPPASPAASVHTAPGVEQLLQYFVAAKRSLSSTNYVWRANELVNSSRSLVEEIAVLNARNAFTERAVNEQVDTLYHIRDEVAAAGTVAGDEFQVTIRKLDLANDRLERTLSALKKTIVDVSLTRDYPSWENAVNGKEDASPSPPQPTQEKTLYDFIDESNHSSLQSSLRDLIDTFNDARADLESSITLFSDSLRTITDTVSNKTQPAEPPDISKVYDEPAQPTSHLFRSMEDHAGEMAKLLESLVSHYDLCVTALKHTEGGGEAAKRAIQQAENGELLEAAASPGINGGAGRGGVEESLYLKKLPKPLPPSERLEMLRVLANDAREVDDVVTEIKDRNVEQEKQSSILSTRVSDSRSKRHALAQVAEMLHETRTLHIPSHLHALSTFKSTWTRIRSSIAAQTEELASLSSFYDGFLSGYAKLLREVDRRREAEMKMRKVADKARRDLERLHEADRELRSEFMEETGKFLPQGIWGGLMDEGVRWEVRKANSDSD